MKIQTAIEIQSFLHGHIKAAAELGLPPEAIFEAVEDAMLDASAHVKLSKQERYALLIGARHASEAYEAYTDEVFH